MREKIFKDLDIVKTRLRDIKHLLRIVKRLSVKFRGKPLHDLEIIRIGKLSRHGSVFMPVAICGDAALREHPDTPLRERDTVLFQRLINDRVLGIDRVEEHLLRLKRELFLVLYEILEHL